MLKKFEISIYLDHLLRTDNGDIKTKFDENLMTPFLRETVLLNREVSEGTVYDELGVSGVCLIGRNQCHSGILHPSNSSEACLIFAKSLKQTSRGSPNFAVGPHHQRVTHMPQVGEVTAGVDCRWHNCGERRCFIGDSSGII